MVVPTVKCKNKVSKRKFISSFQEVSLKWLMCTKWILLKTFFNKFIYKNVFYVLNNFLFEILSKNWHSKIVLKSDNLFPTLFIQKKKKTEV